MNPPEAPSQGISFLDSLSRASAILALLAVLAIVCVPLVESTSDVGSRASRTLINGRHLAMIASAMAIDREATGDALLGGWPGDIKDLNTVSQYLDLMIQVNYLKKEEAANLLTIPGATPRDGKSPLDVEKHCAFKFYKVRAKDGNETLFLASRNYTYNTALTAADANKIQLGEKGFIVVHKNCSAMFLKLAPCPAIPTPIPPASRPPIPSSFQNSTLESAGTGMAPHPL